MQQSELQDWCARAYAGFTYKEDGAIDTWLSHADDVLADRPWEDDCDGLAETVLDLCCRAGLPKEDAFRLAVFASSDGSGHMVGCVYDDNNRIWIVGDTFRPGPYPAEQMLHKPNVYNQLSEIEWRKGSPWALEKVV